MEVKKQMEPLIDRLDSLNNQRIAITKEQLKLSAERKRLRASLTVLERDLFEFGLELDRK